MPLKEVLRLTVPKRKGQITPHKGTRGSTGVRQKAEEAKGNEMAEEEKKQRTLVSEGYSFEVFVLQVLSYLFIFI